MDKTRSPLFYLLATLVLFFSCTKSDDNQARFTTTINAEGVTVVSNPEFSARQNAVKPPVSFEVLESISIEETSGLLLGSVTAVETDESGTIYFMDYQESKLVALNPNGSLKWVTGQKGRGPGDFDNAYSMSLYADKLYITNEMGNRIDLFDLDGNFLETFLLPKEVQMVTLLGVTDSEKMIVSAPFWGNLGENIHVLFMGDSLVSDASFPIHQAEGDLGEFSGFSARASSYVWDNLIYSGHLSEYKIQLIDLEGNLQKIITRDFNKLVRPGVTETSSGSKSMRVFGGLNAPMKLNDHYFVAPTRWPTNVTDPDDFVRRSSADEALEVEFEQSLEFFTHEGELIYSLNDPVFFEKYGNLSHVDSKGNLYFLASTPVYTISILSLTKEEG